VPRIHRYANAVHDAEGRLYVAEAHGRAGADGLWDGWLEFIGVGREIVLRTATETRQSDRRALVYWASGLQPSYLEGALVRAVRARLEAFSRS
jgi:hypothetical protein